MTVISIFYWAQGTSKMKILGMQIYHITSTILLLLWRFTVALQQDYEEVLYANACFHQVKKSLTLTCNKDEMVKLNRIFYAYSEDNSCTYQPGHCTMDLPESESYSCIGKSTCTINLPTGDLGRYIPKCSHSGTYVQAEFQCIPATATTDICHENTATLISQRGFISTPNYPYNYPSSQDCTLKIQAPYHDQQIRLYIIDLTLEQNITDCADWLHLFDGHRGHTFCAARAQEEALVTLEYWLEINFYSDHINNRKGFWLYYEATPYRSSTTVEQQPSQDTTTSTAGGRVSRTHRVTHQTTPSQSNSAQTYAAQTQPQPGNALTVGAIVGVAVSLLLMITVIVLVILVCKRKDHSSNTVKVPSSASCNSEAAFLNLGPNCYAQSHQPLSAPATADYNHMVNSGNQYPLHKAINSNNCDATDIKDTNTANSDAFNSISVNDYRLDADYYKKSGRYLEEVI